MKRVIAVLSLSAVLCFASACGSAAPQFVDEFNAEAADKNGDINALAELSNSKVEKLADFFH
ncbi:MAG TPA: hypothetical protein PLN48_14875 [Lachnospiraceae bacterium]|jgi:hypothetical protein|nr:hypothetical protein [Lachnospiraceae bacterium]